MAKTYLQLVNSVLKRLRVTQVGTVSESEYSSLISEFVNDAKRVVEDAWDWQALQRAVSFNISASIQDYNLSSAALVGAGNVLSDRARLLFDPDTDEPLAFDVTPGTQMPLCKRTLDWVRTDRDMQQTPNTQQFPSAFAVDRQLDAVYIRLSEIPTTTRSWKMYFCDPKPDLSSDSDSLYVPHLPVVLLAVYYALNERGEEIGESATLAQTRADIALSDAIAYDAAQQERKTDFRPS